MEDVQLKWFKITPLNLENINQHIPKTAGIYRLSYKQGDDFYIFFVGEALNLHETVLTHFQNEVNNPCIALKIKNNECAFRFAEHDNVAVRQITVKKAYHHYAPSCNDKLPIANDDINVNLS